MRAAQSPNEAEDILARVRSADRGHRFSRVARPAASSENSRRDDDHTAGEPPQKRSSADYGCLAASRGPPQPVPSPIGRMPPGAKRNVPLLSSPGSSRHPQDHGGFGNHLSGNNAGQCRIIGIRRKQIILRPLVCRELGREETTFHRVTGRHLCDDRKTGCVMEMPGNFHGIRSSPRNPGGLACSCATAPRS